MSSPDPDQPKIKVSWSVLRMRPRLCSRISDSNLAKLMRIAIEAPDLTTVDFNEIIDVFQGGKTTVLTCK